jgi:hypothetical protein
MDFAELGNLTQNIVEGTNQSPDVCMGDIEVLNDPCQSNNNLQANTINFTDTETDTSEFFEPQIDQQYSLPTIKNKQSSLSDGIGWESENQAICKRHKPPRVLKSGKFTCSNLTIGLLNIAGRDVNISMHNHRGHAPPLISS